MSNDANLDGVLRSLGFALNLNTTDAWYKLCTIFTARLSERQLVGIAFAALRSINKNVAREITQIAVGETSGPPIAPLISQMDEAAFWADLAEPEAIEAYCFVCFHSMPPARQVEFLAFMQGRASA